MVGVGGSQSKRAGLLRCVTFISADHCYALVAVMNADSKYAVGLRVIQLLVLSRSFLRRLSAILRPHKIDRKTRLTCVPDWLPSFLLPTPVRFIESQRTHA